MDEGQENIAPEKGSHSPISLCSGIAGWSPMGRIVYVALLEHLDCDVQDKSLCLWEPPMVPDPSPDPEVPMEGQARAGAT